MSRSLFLIHARKSFKDDLSSLGQNVNGLLEETLEVLMPNSPPNLVPIFEYRGGGENNEQIIVSGTPPKYLPRIS
jgi:hypothetical protein